jgi:hypothetical protein
VGELIDHTYDPVRDRFTPRVSEEATAESLAVRIEATRVAYENSTSEEERARLGFDLSCLLDDRNRLYPENIE